MDSYNRGNRAYINKEGEKFIQEGICNRYVFTDREIADWQALRDYQDAERKKGVPIEDFGPEWESRDYDYEDEKGWTSNIFHALGWGYDPIHQYYCDIPCARFTNFRWRAGYPKGGQNG